ncbi:hypothetical protein N7523_005893 [Penicillium sp. IBT 18751x]|nr:hypothetical protein N7523_005893 [Penicillium sp. IBT 18751x]
MASRTNFHQYPGIFRKCPIQILVGPAKTTFYIHPGVLSSCGSPVLEARINGPWTTNGPSGAIDWAEFDENTVECALSYLYVGDYDVCEQNVVGEHIEGGSEDDKFGHQESLSTKSESSQVPLERPLTPLSRCLQVGLPAQIIQTAAAAFNKESHCCDKHIGNIAFIHAKVYCFAHQFLISGLEDLALQRLTQLLLVCDIPTSSFFVHLADVIRLVYSSTPKSKLNNPARELLSQYVALKYTTLSECLNTLIAEGGDFMIDVSRKLTRRIQTSGESARSLEDQIDELETRIQRLELEAERQTGLLERAKQEIAEWESWNRGISGKHRKARRVVAPYEFQPTPVEYSA